MFKIGSFTKNFIKNTVGTWKKQGRMLNMDQGTYLIGYAEVNQQATTPFSRTRVHKGYFFCDDDAVKEGELVEDRTERRIYLVMSLKKEILNDEIVYYDGTLYNCDDTLTVQRFEDGPRDAFGRPTERTATTIATGIFAMVAPQNFDIMEQPDRTISHDKVSVYSQTKFTCTVASPTHVIGDLVEFQPKDRLISSKGSVYIINSIDAASLNGIVILKVDQDAR